MRIEKTIKVNTCIVGSGAAGYNAADRLWQYGQKNILLISEDRKAGTSRNTGSDKQTYYKLTLSGETPDSVFEMAQTLYDGKCVDGDLALCEAALSVPSFLRLVELGMEFPVNRYGEYAGYKTDHDPRSRATSIGPYTSRRMTEVLEKQFFDYEIPYMDHLQVIRILSDGIRIYGLLCLDTETCSDFVLIQCPNIIYATGGPAAIYRNRVYPSSQFGSSGLAFEAGAKGKNLTEWQFGLASISPKWNVSGSYMQALPKMISVDDSGAENEFLSDFFDCPEEMLGKLFLKGYQWPFDVRKVANGSSIIDILVYMELAKGNKVYLDFREEPVGGRFHLDRLPEEASAYLRKTGAFVHLPIERLKIMNQPAIDFYREKGIDLEKERLEISLCAQHNNGGIDVDCHWQSNVEGLFAAGEVAGTHGVYRPGGSALNAGQVGSTRAAQYIAARRKQCAVDEERFSQLSENAVREMTAVADKAFSDQSNVAGYIVKISNGMSLYAGAIRKCDMIRNVLCETDDLLRNFSEKVKITEKNELPMLFRLRDLLISAKCTMSAILDYSAVGGKSRGSAMYIDRNGARPDEKLPDEFSYIIDDGNLDEQIQTVSYHEGDCDVEWRERRPLPVTDDAFEVVWKSYRDTGNID